MKHLPPKTREAAPRDGKAATQNQELQRKATDLNDRLQENYETRSGETTAAAMVPDVLADFYQAAGIPAAEIQPERNPS